jgi:kynureninase
MNEEVALVLLPSVLYRSGQLFDIERVTREAHARGILAGWDCCHSAGAIPHRFDAWEVDFAFWCNYKYLNAGPGSIGSLYVNRRHFGRHPALPGWWGYDKARQFDMSHEWQGAGTAGAWQISTVSVLSAAPLLGSLKIIEDAGIDTIRARSLAMTDYLIELLNESGMLEEPYSYAVGTPLDHARRGGHVAVEHPNGAQINAALKGRGVVPDFRPPNVVRLAPIPLYVSFSDVWDTVKHLREIVDTGEYERQSSERGVVA